MPLDSSGGGEGWHGLAARGKAVCCLTPFVQRQAPQPAPTGAQASPYPAAAVPSLD